MRRSASFLVFSAVCAYGQTVSDPVADYLAFNNTNAYADNTTRKDPYYSDFKVFRLELDLNNDGRNEVLISSTKDRDGKQGNVWSVYEPSGSDYVSAGEMTFSQAGFYLGNIDEINAYGLVTFGPAGGGEGTLSSYLFDGHDMREVQIGSIARDPKTGELQGEGLVHKYMAKGAPGEKVITLDAATLAKEYGIKIDPRTQLQVAQAFLDKQRSEANARQSSSVMTPLADNTATARPVTSPATTDLSAPHQTASSTTDSGKLIWIVAGLILLAAIVSAVWFRRR